MFSKTKKFPSKTTVQVKYTIEKDNVAKQKFPDIL